MHFLDPINDYAFKRIFGDDKNPAILISFLNSILHLEAEKTIEHISIPNPNQVPRIMGIKDTALDVRCRDQSGAEYIVEMQVEKLSALVGQSIEEAGLRQLPGMYLVETGSVLWW